MLEDRQAVQGRAPSMNKKRPEGNEDPNLIFVFVPLMEGKSISIRRIAQVWRSRSSKERGMIKGQQRSQYGWSTENRIVGGKGKAREDAGWSKPS
jgi:hypothetical protein